MSYYEGCTLFEIKAFRDLENESFDFGEGEMKIEGWYGSEDAYYEISIQSLISEYEDNQYHKEEMHNKVKKRKINRHDLNLFHRAKLDELSKLKWWTVSDKGTHKKRCYLSDRRKVAKRQSNKQVRNYKLSITKGSNYRKIYDFWWEIL